MNKELLVKKMPLVLTIAQLAFIVLVFCGGGAPYDYIRGGGCKGSGCYAGGSYRYKMNWYGMAFRPDTGSDAIVGFIMMILSFILVAVFLANELKISKAGTIDKNKAILLTALSFVAWVVCQVGAIFNHTCSYYDSATFMIVMGYFAMTCVILYFALNVYRYILVKNK